MLPTKMFGMGMSEILVILLVAALFLGPEKLPDAASKISKGIRDLRKQTKDLTDTIENDTEIGGAIRDLKSALRGDDLRRPPVRKPPASAQAQASAAAAAAAVEAAEREHLAAASAPADPLPPGAPVDHELVTDAPAPAATAPPATTEPPAVAPSAAPAAITLPATAGDPDRDAAPAAGGADDDDDEHVRLARLVRPASGAIKRDGHGPN
jgi:sec-independent protein translocase protein TatB